MKPNRKIKKLESHSKVGPLEFWVILYIQVITEI